MSAALAVTLALTQTPLWCITPTAVDPEMGDRIREHIQARPNSEDTAFLANGELNLDYRNWMVTLTGPVTAIKAEPNSRSLYQIEPLENCGKPVWVTTFVPVATDQIKEGDQLVFKGFIYSADDLDESGSLAQYIGADTLLIAKTIESDPDLPNTDKPKSQAASDATPNSATGDQAGDQKLSGTHGVKSAPVALEE